ncbi:MAG: InlB B-repeat-containing protein, partial [Clostridia bacterium]|nr:InlB B-repeat-containing protein [Clostridia bacterium]
MGETNGNITYYIALTSSAYKFRTVTYVYDGKVVGDTSQIVLAGQYGTAPSVTNIPEGYELSWTAEESTEDKTGSVIMNGELTVKKYAVNFITNKDTKTETVEHGSSVTAPEVKDAASGYAFIGWSLTSNGDLVDSSAFTNITSEKTFYAVYKLGYNVKFYAADGTELTSLTKLVDPSDSTIQLPPLPELTGYPSLGWTLRKVEENGILSYDRYKSVYTYAGQSEYNVTADANFYANYREKGATFIDAGNNKLTGSYNGTVISAPTNPSYNTTAYEALGWASSGKVLYLQPNESPAGRVVTEFYDGGEYYLVLRLKQYTVTFMDGETELGTKTYSYGASVENAEIEYDGFTYKTGAAKEVDGATYYMLGWDPVVTSVKGNITVKANWSKDTAIPNGYYVVTFLNENGEIYTTQVVESNTLATPPAQPELPEGYINFEGWEINDGVMWNFGEPVTGNMTLTAKFKQYYLVQFFVDNVQVDTGKVSAGGVVVNSEFVPSKDAKKFMGWRLEGENTNFVFGNPTSSDLILHAHFSDIHYLFYETASLPLEPFQYVVDEGEASLAELSELPTPTRTGYTFYGWKMSKDAENTVDLETVKAALKEGNVTLYAVWTGDIVPVEIVIWMQKNKQERADDTTNTANYNVSTTFNAYAVAGSTVNYIAETGTFTGVYTNANKTTAYTVNTTRDTYFELVAAPDMVVSGSGTTLNVFYNRIKYSLEFRFNNNNIQMTFNGQTYGASASTSPRSYVLTAELDENIEDRWPHSGNVTLSSGNLYGWDSLSAKQVSKLVTMTSDACDRARNTGYVTADTSSSDSTFLLVYMFESLPDETVHKTISGVNYTVSDAYTQYTRSSSNSFSAKDIEGMLDGKTESVQSSFANLKLTGYTAPSLPDGMDPATKFEILYYQRNKYTVTLNLNDAAEVNGQAISAVITADALATNLDRSYTGSNSVYTLSNVMYGTALSYVEPDGVPTREHCSFTGWYADAACLEPFDFKQTMPDSNVTIYAGWVVNPVKVTYYMDAEGNDKYDEETNIPYGEEAPAIVNPTVNQQYGEFIGWYYRPFEGTNYTAEFIPGSTVLIGDTEVFAKWRNEDFTVTYKYNDGTDETYMDTDTYELNETMKLMEMDKTIDGKVFIGWKEEGGSSSRLRQGGDPYAVYYDVTFIAQWADETDVNQVIYHANFGSDEKHTQAVPKDAWFYVRGNPFVRPGYTFNGWNTNANGTGTAYTVGGSYPMPAEMDVLNLYAQWSANTDTPYTVEFYYQNTDGDYVKDEARTSKRYGETDSTASVTDPDKAQTEGDLYVLNTEHADSKLSGTIAADGTLVLKLYFKLNTAPYTIHHYLRGTTTKVAEDETGTKTIGETLTAAAVEKEDLFDEYKTAAAVSFDPIGAEITIQLDSTKNVISVYYVIPLTITADSDSKVYDGTALTKDSYTSEGLVAGDSIESVAVTGSRTVVGTSNNVPSAAVIKNAAGDDITTSYNITYANGTLEVTKKAITITADSDSKVYDGSALTKNSYTNTALATGD